LDEAGSSALLTDLYELTMLQGYWKEGKANDTAVFDLSYRHPPYGGSFIVAAGIKDAIDYVANLKFTVADLEYLQGLGIFEPEFLEYLKGWKFTGDVFSVVEGEVVAPQTPIMVVSGPLMESQLIETALLNKINFQSLIATKASRIVYAAEDCPVIDFGLRRAQGRSHLEATRASVIGGVKGTSNVLAGKVFKIPVKGTQAHSWVQSFKSELEAFRAYARCYPRSCLLLIDTYDTLEIGLPNAITVAKEMMEKDPDFAFLGVRIDSGDLAYLAAKADEIISKAGLPETVKIVLSNDLDERSIQSIIQQLRRRGAHGAVKRLIFGVGTNMITGSPEPALGGVYKLVEHNVDPKIKVSSNIEKTTIPGKKDVVRVYDKDGPTMDILVDTPRLPKFLKQMEYFPETVTVHHPTDPNKTYQFKRGEVLRTRSLLIPVMLGGKPTGELTDDLGVIQEYSGKTLGEFDHSFRRLENPHIYRVSLEIRLWETKQRLIVDALKQRG
jgi:nicotinate phosphoribosyltransferase